MSIPPSALVETLRLGAKVDAGGAVRKRKKNGYSAPEDFALQESVDGRDCGRIDRRKPWQTLRSISRETLIKPFDRLRTNGKLLIPFMVRLSNHR